MVLTPPRLPAPPLNALRAFEAAARHASFQRAAEELSVTPGAVAQLVKKLEAWAGGPLFERHAQGVVPTALALRALARLTQGFDMLDDASRVLREAAQDREVRIAALPSIAQLWLSPRLSELAERLPGVGVSIRALDNRPSLQRDGFDLAIYPAEPGPDASLLSPSVLTPVAAPSIARKLSTPLDLLDTVLIHDLAWKHDWRHWIEAHPVPGIDPDHGPAYSLYSMAVERCVAGDGALMGHLTLVETHLADGRLVAPFPGLSVPAVPICLFQPRDTASDTVAATANTLFELAARPI